MNSIERGRDADLAAFQKEMSDIIDAERTAGEHAHFKESVDTHELTHEDMGMRRFVQDLESRVYVFERKGDIAQWERLLKRYKKEVEGRKNTSRTIYARWLINGAHALLARAVDALEKKPGFLKEIIALREEHRERKARGDAYDRGFDKQFDVRALTRDDMETYRWLKELSGYRLADLERLAKERLQKEASARHASEDVRMTMRGKMPKGYGRFPKGQVNEKIEEVLKDMWGRYNAYIDRTNANGHPTRRAFKHILGGIYATPALSRLDMSHEFGYDIILGSAKDTKDIA